MGIIIFESTLILISVVAPYLRYKNPNWGDTYFTVNSNRSVVYNSINSQEYVLSCFEKAFWLKEYFKIVVYTVRKLIFSNEVPSYNIFFIIRGRRCTWLLKSISFWHHICSDNWCTTLHYCWLLKCLRNDRHSIITS